MKFIPGPKPTSSRFVDRTGQTFGYLHAREYYGKTQPNSESVYVCRCICGKDILVSVQRLRSGETRSCGCMSRAMSSESKTVHGGSRRSGYSPLYWVLQGMKSRCYNTKSRGYRNYGGRGIKICDEWKNDFSAFERWAISTGYKNGLTIERVDVNGNYCPENCTWIPQCDQSKNRRRTKWITAFGERKTTADWSRDERCQVSRRSLADRVFKKGWDAELAITIPPSPGHPPKWLGGTGATQKEGGAA